MPNSVEDRVRTIIAKELGVPPENVRTETPLRLGDLMTPLAAAALHFDNTPEKFVPDEQVSWGRLYGIASKIERMFGVRFDMGAPDTWTSIGDVVDATEAAIARDAAPATSRDRGCAA